jgi:hypothetical protein
MRTGRGVSNPVITDRVEMTGPLLPTPGQRPPHQNRANTGYPEPGSSNVMLAYGFLARHVKGLELANISFSFATDDFRPAIGCVDVNGLFKKT